jgi:hypothetical protein
MKEDLIELVTSLTITNNLSDYLLLLCRVSTREEEMILNKKISSFKLLHPEQVGLSSWFTLNKSSRLFSVFKTAREKNDTVEAKKESIGLQEEDFAELRFETSPTMQEEEKRFENSP